MDERKCEICGCSFQPTTTWQVYCSEACRIKAKLEERRKRIEAKEVITKARADACTRENCIHWKTRYANRCQALAIVDYRGDKCDFFKPKEAQKGGK